MQNVCRQSTLPALNTYTRNTVYGGSNYEGLNTFICPIKKPPPQDFTGQTFYTISVSDGALHAAPGRCSNVITHIPVNSKVRNSIVRITLFNFGSKTQSNVLDYCVQIVTPRVFQVGGWTISSDKVTNIVMKPQQSFTQVSTGKWWLLDKGFMLHGSYYNHQDGNNSQLIYLEFFDKICPQVRRGNINFMLPDQLVFEQRNLLQEMILRIPQILWFTKSEEEIKNSNFKRISYNEAFKLHTCKYIGK